MSKVRTVPSTLKFIVFDEDVGCLAEHWDHPQCPILTYRLLPGGINPRRSIVLRRYGIWPGEACIEPRAYEKLSADLAGDAEAHLLMLRPGEFVALQVHTWRQRHQIAHRGSPPMARWSALNALALYKRARATSAKRYDDAKSIMEARAYFRQKYANEHEMLPSTNGRDTVH